MVCGIKILINSIRTVLHGPNYLQVSNGFALGQDINFLDDNGSDFVSGIGRFGIH